MSNPATELLVRIFSEERDQAIDRTPFDRTVEEGRKPTREELHAWLSQFTYAQKLFLLEILRALHAEQETEKSLLTDQIRKP